MATPETPPQTKREAYFNAQRSSPGSQASGSRSGPTSHPQQRYAAAQDPGEYTLPTHYRRLSEVATPSPIQNPREYTFYRHDDLEDEREAQRRSSSGKSSRPATDRRTSRSAGKRRASASKAGPSQPREDSRAVEQYNMPDNYDFLHEVLSPPVIENPGENRLRRHSTLEDEQRKVVESHSRSRSRRQSQSPDIPRNKKSGHGRGQTFPGEQIPTKLAAPPQVQGEAASGRHRKKEDLESSSSTEAVGGEAEKRPNAQQRASQFATELYTISYLILFSILGTLARLGIQWLTFYPGAPVVLGVLWANFAGSLFFGFLAEDRRLFRDEWGVLSNQSNSSSFLPMLSLNRRRPPDGESQNVAHRKVKKTIPLYIGLATGFCGCLTSFSSFMRDTFLALSNNLPTPVNHQYPAGTTVSSTQTVSRNGGYSFEASVAVIVLTLCLCLSALKVGAHLAIFLDPFTPTLPYALLRKILDRVTVFVAFGAWLGAIFMAIWPPDRPGGPDSHGSWAKETWRGQAVFACVFAPLGCLLRFYASIKLNGISAAFPLGTFAVNILGTAVEGMAWDFQHVPLAQSAVGGGVIGCQVLQGVMDGFCGCLTTVSTWVAELNGLRRRHSYTYGCASVLGGLSLMVVIMGSVRWTIGWSEPVCVAGRH